VVKVIKEGKIETYEIKCKVCKSILHFIKNDLYKDSDNLGYYSYIMCPVCSSKVSASCNYYKGVNMNDEIYYKKVEEGNDGNS
jgi:DNA-directed RNA polymerase subunit RPC12/RpoP